MRMELWRRLIDEARLVENGQDRRTFVLRKTASDLSWNRRPIGGERSARQGTAHERHSREAERDADRPERIFLREFKGNLD